MGYSADSILKVLDADAKRFGFPGFNNMNYHMVAARLTGLRDDLRWALVFEQIVWWPAADGMMPVVWAYGNCLSPGIFGAPEGQGFVNWRSTSIESSFDDEGQVDPSSIAIRGVPVELHDEDVEAHSEVGERGFDYLVHLVSQHRTRLLMTEAELRSIVPGDLPEIIQLDDWHHPNVYHGEAPSAARSMQMLAEVLATGDAGRYRPCEPPNVDWRLWLSR